MKKKTAKKKTAKKATSKKKKAVAQEPQVEQELPSEVIPFAAYIDDEGIMHVTLSFVERGKTKSGNTKYGFADENARFIPADVEDQFGDMLSTIMPANTIVIIKDKN